MLRSVAVLLWIMAPVRHTPAQKCVSETGGGGPQLGKCTNPGPTIPFFGLPRSRSSNYMGPSFPGNGLNVLNYLDTTIPGFGSGDSGIDTVTSTRGTWHQASGEFILPV
ncbi:MAG: hypothetical protein ACE5F1_11310, partial [Planctomycetota bacterium]